MPSPLRTVCPAQQVSDSLDAWHRIDTPATVLDWVQHGIKLPLIEDPPPFCLPNHPSSTAQSAFIDTEIKKLCTSGAIRECGADDIPVCVSPIACVPKKNNKFRLIVDLRQLNGYIETPSFQYDGIDTVAELIAPNDRLITADLKDGFHHVRIHRDFQKYLGIFWNNIFYTWTVLPFGLSCSPYFFHKFLRPVVQYFRANGLRVVIYVDDK